jgi:hypothetical protein
MMKRLLAIVAFVVGCGSTEPDGPTPTAFERTYVAFSCYRAVNDDFTGPPPDRLPCDHEGAGSYRHYVDSGRVEFRADSTVTAMIGTHTWTCPCHLGGCNDPCYHQPGSVASAAGTYLLTNDTIRIQFADSSNVVHLPMIGTLPRAGTPPWNGPDFIKGPFGGGAMVWFRPD